MIFTGAVACALLLQSLAFMGIYLSIRRVTARMDELSKNLLKKVDALSTNADNLMSTIMGMAEGLKSIQEKLANATAIVHKRVVDLDAFMAETTDAARLEILRIQDVVDTASRRLEETFEILRNSILTPASEVKAVIRGIRVGMDVLFRARKSPSSPPLHDEEMFI